MKPVLLMLIAALFGAAYAQEDDPGHMHGPDGRHIVAPQDGPKGSDQFILSHHDMRIEGPDGKSVLGCSVDSKISKKGAPDEVVHTEHNAYEPENEVYGSHMTYTEPGEYVLAQAVTLPDGKRVDVEFPVFVPEVAAAEPVHAHGPNYLLIGGGILGGLLLLRAVYRLGQKNTRAGGAALLALALVGATTLARVSFAQGGAAPALLAYPAPNKGVSAEKTVDGFRFVLSIENEEMTPDPALVAIGEEQAKLIGLKVEEVAFSPTGGGLQTTGHISADPDGLVIINARASGRVATLGALPGTTVRRGQMLAVIESPDLAEAQAAYRLAHAQVAQAETTVQAAASGVASGQTKAAAAGRLLARQRDLAEAGAFASPALESAKSQLSTADAKAATGRTQLRALQATVARLEKGVASGVVAKRDLDVAKADAEAAATALADAERQRGLAQEVLAREEGIARKGLRNAAEVEAAQAEVDLASAALAAAKASLAQARAELVRAQGQVRSARDQITLLGGTPGSGNRITITAPISGEVEHRNVSAGQTVTVGQQLYDLLNADVVWVLCDLYEMDIARVKVGQRVEVVADALPGQTYIGEVAFIHNEVDPEARTTKVRVVVDNPGEKLKQNMFVRVQLGTGGAGQTLVPTAAVQTTAGVSTVFLEEKPGTYRQIVVQIAGTLGNRTLVRAGLKPGDRVVTDGAYQLLAKAVSQ